MISSIMISGPLRLQIPPVSVLVWQRGGVYSGGYKNNMSSASKGYSARRHIYQNLPSWWGAWWHVGMYDTGAGAESSDLMCQL